MNRHEFADFYILGIDVSSRDNPPTMLNAQCEEVDPVSSPNEYAFYFAKQCIEDVNSRNRNDWGKMPLAKWFLFYRLPSMVADLFKTRKRGKR
jgi:hypothetical protein